MDRPPHPIDQQVLRWRASEQDAAADEIRVVFDCSQQNSVPLGSWDRRSDQHRFQILRDNGLNVQLNASFKRGLTLSVVGVVR